MTLGYKVTSTTSADAGLVLTMIKELAEFEKALKEVKVTEEQLEKALEKERLCGFLIWEGSECAAMVLYFYGYSSWEGEFLFMEDLYVRKQYRRKGYGMRCWQELAKLAKEKNMRMIQWHCLDWNVNAINFYKSMSAIEMTNEGGWLMYRLDPEGINQLADSVTK